jgi:hypothetical protein
MDKGAIKNGYRIFAWHSTHFQVGDNSKIEGGGILQKQSRILLSL